MEDELGLSEPTSAPSDPFGMEGAPPLGDPPPADDDFGMGGAPPLGEPPADDFGAGHHHPVAAPAAAARRRATR